VKYIKGFLAVVVLLVILIGVSEYKSKYLPTIQRNNMAKELGIKSIDEYPPPINFPYGYFESLLKPGMSLEEVHKIVRGYKRVLTCNKNKKIYYFEEIYYFYSIDDEKALRMRILYDPEKRFKEIRVEDLNSRTYSVTGCDEGELQ
jgi:hypothetical protein